MKRRVPAVSLQNPSARPRPRPQPRARSAFLLINLGTPDGTSYWPMRRYLKEFLSDRRVIETNRVLWWLILNLVVLVKRPSASGAKYRSIWNEATRQVAAAHHHAQPGGEGRPRARREEECRGRLGDALRQPEHRLAHRRLDRVKAATGCCVFPLYPQYAAASTATANDKVFDALKTLRAQPALRTVPPYPQDPVYIAALADSIRAHLAGLDFEPEAIIASFHGVPQAYVDKGDPYQKQCMRDDGGPARGARAARRQAQDDVPVALRPRRVDQALYRQDGRGAGARRGEADRHRHARLCRRLPRDARGDRRGEQGDLPASMAARGSATSPASTTARVASRCSSI